MTLYKLNTTTVKLGDVYLHVVIYGGEIYCLIELEDQKVSIAVEYWSVFQSLSTTCIQWHFLSLRQYIMYMQTYGP